MAPRWWLRTLGVGIAWTLGGLLVIGIASAQPPPSAREVHHIHGVALDRRDPEVVYVATHTGLVRIRPTGPPEWLGAPFDLMGFTAHPRDADLVYASGHPDLDTYRAQKIGSLGLLLSRDGGSTWRSVAVKGQADFHALTFSPRDGGQLYGWNVGEEQAGLYRISATRWAAERLPARGLSDVLSLASSPAPSGPLLAGTKAGLMASKDGGLNWVRVPAIPTDTAVTAVSYHATDARAVYVYVSRPDLGLLRSRDGGATWEPTALRMEASVRVVALAVGPDSHLVVATTRSDVVRSRDGGRTWLAVVERGRPVATGR